MTVRERILAIRLLEKQEHNPRYTQKIGIQVCMVKNGPMDKVNENVKGGK